MNGGADVQSLPVFPQANRDDLNNLLIRGHNSLSSLGKCVVQMPNKRDAACLMKGCVVMLE